MKTSSILLPLFAAASAWAHGNLVSMQINGQSPQGSDVRNGDSYIRRASSQDPNYGAFNPALTCGPNAQRAKLSANVMPGDELAFSWREANDGLVSLIFSYSCLDVVDPDGFLIVAPQHWTHVDLHG